MMTTRRKPRPVFLNLLLIRMPVTAVVSIGHRISGVLLFLAIPFAIYLLQLSVQGPQGHAEAIALFESRAVRLMTALMVWAYAHHLFAGIRFLLLDVDLGIGISEARAAAWMVNVLGLFVLVVGLAVLW
jgi:succinate dehydrogenase / fumarate reductase, cytochrome b subunit